MLKICCSAVCSVYCEGLGRAGSQSGRRSRAADQPAQVKPCCTPCRASSQLMTCVLCTVNDSAELVRSLVGGLELLVNLLKSDHLQAPRCTPRRASSQLITLQCSVYCEGLGGAGSQSGGWSRAAGQPAQVRSSAGARQRVRCHSNGCPWRRREPCRDDRSRCRGAAGKTHLHGQW